MWKGTQTLAVVAVSATLLLTISAFAQQNGEQQSGQQQNGGQSLTYKECVDSCKKTYDDAVFVCNAEQSDILRAQCLEKARATLEACIRACN
jgi:hypothetical protein